MTGYNLPLLRKERDWVAEQCVLPYKKSQLNMDYWYLDDEESLAALGKECGTTYCVAGHIAATTPGALWSGTRIVVDGQLRDLVHWARQQLGIDRAEAAEIFYSDDDEVLDVLDAIIAHAERIEAAEHEQEKEK